MLERLAGDCYKHQSSRTVCLSPIIGNQFDVLGSKLPQFKVGVMSLVDVADEKLIEY